MFQNLGFFGLVQKGGVTVLVLMFFSLISVAVMLESARVYKIQALAQRLL
jgi:hypothetical protein